MTDKKIKKLKRKVWFISTSILLIYVALLITNPSTWTGLIPIIIPASGLTVGIPVYSSLRHNSLKKEMKDKTKEYINNVINNQTIKKNETVSDYQQEVIIGVDNDINIKSDKPKIKTKGTIN